MKLEITAVVSSAKGYSRVIVSRALFDAVKGQKPVLECKDLGQSEGNRVRLFNVEGNELYSFYNTADRKTTFAVKDSVAKQFALPTADLPFAIGDLVTK